jgi:hypothetical protein
MVVFVRYAGALRNLGREKVVPRQKPSKLGERLGRQIESVTFLQKSVPLRFIGGDGLDLNTPVRSEEDVVASAERVPVEQRDGGHGVVIDGRRGFGGAAAGDSQREQRAGERPFDS